ncbi:peptidylprolyl isomerase [candidate division KSB1 bacterium]|nr:peptidylprolyl isomerase [candidate division KSB1 bacterium]
MSLSRARLVILLVIVMMQFTALTAQTLVYVNVAEENLRNAPNGRKIGSLLENTEMVAVDENENWVQVQITGWIWKPSLSMIKTTLTGEFRALHIMVQSRAEADAIVKELAAGKDFGELARARSKAPSAAIGGDLGYFNKGDFNPAFERAITSLQVNQVSDIVEMKGTYNIFKRTK